MKYTIKAKNAYHGGNLSVDFRTFCSVPASFRATKIFDVDANVLIRAVMESDRRRKLNERENNVEKR